MSILDKLFNNCDETEIVKRKAESFDKIAAMFYEKNFGSATKSEIELQMFSILVDVMIDNNIDRNDVLNYDKCSDYEIGKMLGIPQEKVRTLKIKKQARYPREFDWKESLQSIKESIVYDASKEKIIIPMRDPNLYNEIRNFIEEKGGYIEIQRGNNYLQMRPEYFFILLYKASDDEEDKRIIRENFAKKLRKHNEDTSIDEIKTDKELSEIALSYGNDFFELAKSIVEGVSNPLVAIISGIQCISKIAKKSIKK